MAEEPCGFYAGVFLVLAGMVFILGMGVYSIYNPLKVPKCEPLDELLNGEIVLSMPEDDGVNNNKTKVFFSCDAGYRLVGPDTKVCHDPDWRPADPVSCKKME